MDLPEREWKINEELTRRVSGLRLSQGEYFKNYFILLFFTIFVVIIPDGVCCYARATHYPALVACDQSAHHLPPSL